MQNEYMTQKSRELTYQLHLTKVKGEGRIDIVAILNPALKHFVCLRTTVSATIKGDNPGASTKLTYSFSRPLIGTGGSIALTQTKTQRIELPKLLMSPSRRHHEILALPHMSRSGRRSRTPQ
jgi:hypothetical protein